MLEDAFWYPMEGEESRKTLLVGGGIYLASAGIGVFAGLLSLIPLVGWVLGPLVGLLGVVPNVLIGGYSVAVCRSVMAGETSPPQFDDWEGLLRDGVKVVAIGVLYALPAIAVGVVGLLVVLVLSLLLGSNSSVASGVFLVVSGLGSLVVFAYALVVAYVLPAAIVNFARTDRLSAAWDADALRQIATSGEYARPWALGFAFLLVANLVGGSLAVVLVGFLVLFYGQVAAMYLYASGVMDSGGLEYAGPAPSPDDDETAVEDDAGTDTAGDAEAAADPTGADADDPGAGDASTDDDGAGDAGGADRDLEAVTGVGPTTAESLRAAGFESIADLRAATRSDLAEVEGIGPAKADRIKEDVGDD
jgi:predicted flap endonuclease-1-like 5' DNA nuclease